MDNGDLLVVKNLKNRLARFMKTLWHWCRENRHEPIKEQYKELARSCGGITSIMEYEATMMLWRLFSSMQRGPGGSG